ncbi:Nitrogen permease regulator 3 [Marasmius sp. AFHP31]|nr:Nitrogen permease regulator 3 [Marasmius sp. AFHP31]
MAETLPVVLFVTSSAKGSNLVLRWPPLPSTPARVSRALSESQGNTEASYKRRNPTSPIMNDSSQGSTKRDEYDEAFGYSSEFLASILCPHRSMCHQKFELMVDDLAFISHPVCPDGGGI